MVEKIWCFDENILFYIVIKCVKWLCEEGVIIIEVKLGYGLDLDIEVCMLCVVKFFE